MITLTAIRHELRVLIHQMGMVVMSMRGTPKATFTNIFGMLLNNILFFIVWVLVFQLVPDLKGWTLSDVAMMYGLGATCFGLAGALFGGFRSMVDDIESGKFDSFLGKPTSPFILMITSRATPHAWGDALTGPVFWLVFCHLTMTQVLLLMIMMMAGAVICMSVGVAIYSIAFWVRGMRNHADVILYAAIGFLTTPLHGMPYWVKFILFTILPMGYVAYLPVEMIRAPSIWVFAAIFGGAIWALILGRFVFYLGLRQYKGVSSLRTGA